MFYKEMFCANPFKNFGQLLDNAAGYMVKYNPSLKSRRVMRM